MTSKPRSIKAQRDAEKARIANINKRYLDRNWEAQKFCNDHGLRVYAASQAYSPSKVKLFRQKGEKFLPISEKLYDQNEPNEVKEYCAAIDIEYERIYHKMKDKVK